MKQAGERVCRRIEPLIDSYADGELNRLEAAVVKGHLRSCSSCREALEQCWELKQLIRQTDDTPAMPQSIHASVMQAVRQMPVKQTRHPVPWRRYAGAVAVAACFILVLGGAWIATLGGAFASKDAMAPESAAPDREENFSQNVPSGEMQEQDGVGNLEDRVDPVDPTEPLAPMDPVDPVAPMPPSTPGYSVHAFLVGEVYKLGRVSGGEQPNTLDGIWEGEDLYLCVEIDEGRALLGVDGRTRETDITWNDDALTLSWEEGQVRFSAEILDGALYLTVLSSK